MTNDDLGNRDDSSPSADLDRARSTTHDRHHPVRLRNYQPAARWSTWQPTTPVGAEVMLDLGDAGQIHRRPSSWACGDKAGLRFQKSSTSTCLAERQAATSRSHQMGLDRTILEPGVEDDRFPWATPMGAQCPSTSCAQDLEGFLKRYLQSSRIRLVCLVSAHAHERDHG